MTQKSKKVLTSYNGQTVTQEMLDEWSQSLDNDVWPKGWTNRGPVKQGRPSLSADETSSITIKIPAAMKRTIVSNAKREGLTTSAYVRKLVISSLV